MRLNELFPRNKLSLKPTDVVGALNTPWEPDSGDDDDFGAFRRMLQDRGFQSYGSGAFGYVFSHPSLSYVIKVFDTSRDKGYLAFVRYCLAHSGNPHLPKFRGKFTKIDATRYWCRMEILDPLPKDKKEMIKPLADFLRNTYKATQQIASVDDVIMNVGVHSIPRSFYQTVLDVFATSINLGLYLDLHGNNVMERDYTMVIIDPFLPMWTDD